MNNQPFLWKARGASFSFAFRGVVAFFRTEHNARLHGGLTASALLLSFFLHINRIEFILILIVISFVWITEIINTAIEKSMDFISTEKHPLIALVKDLAAAAVLVSAVAAFVIGMIIFLPKILNYV